MYFPQDETFGTIRELEQQEVLMMDDVKLYAWFTNYLQHLINSGATFYSEVY